jgi:hypothetical protein
MTRRNLVMVRKGRQKWTRNSEESLVLVVQGYLPGVREGFSEEGTSEPRA